MNQPLVSVICLCYNHGRFVREAIASVLHQTYKNIQIIVVDDASTDNSVREIHNVMARNSAIQFLRLERNYGNCKAFNRGLALATGDFIVDFATDDVMLPARIENQVKLFSSLDPSYGVVFTDATYIDDYGKAFRTHYAYLAGKNLLQKIPEGDVYRNVLSTYFIASPTMLVRRRVFDDLKGYDEHLAYEDFDFWVRSSRDYKYAFLNEKLTNVRRTRQSMSSGWYKKGDRQLYSTYLVCKKAQYLNRSEEDRSALVKRVRYELRQSVFSQNYHEADLFYELLTALESRTLADVFLNKLNKFRLPLSVIRNIYHRIKFG